jgi:hypothetical protein
MLASGSAGGSCFEKKKVDAEVEVDGVLVEQRRRLAGVGFLVERLQRLLADLGAGGVDDVER